jgi:hypothetical protein
MLVAPLDDPPPGRGGTWTFGGVSWGDLVAHPGHPHGLHVVVHLGVVVGALEARQADHHGGRLRLGLGDEPGVWRVV